MPYLHAHAQASGMLFDRLLAAGKQAFLEKTQPAATGFTSRISHTNPQAVADS